MRWRTIPIRVPDRAFLTMRQVCVAVGMNEKTVREWVRLGVFPPGEMIGGRTRWENKAVGLWLEMRRYMPILDCSPGRSGHAEPSSKPSPEGGEDENVLAGRQKPPRKG